MISYVADKVAEFFIEDGITAGTACRSTLMSLVEAVEHLSTVPSCLDTFRRLVISSQLSKFYYQCLQY